MANLNKVFLIGNLTRDPELRYTQGGAPVANFGLAVNRKYKDASGELKEETCFVDITVWGRRAEVCGEYLKKGRPVFIEGRLQLHTWETENKEKRSKLRVVADNFQFLGQGPGKSAGGPPEAGEAPAAGGAPAAGKGDDLALDDENIPF
ncbi:MAG: single-stranded DNA-binding protein [Planctomycetota bacterium]